MMMQSNDRDVFEEGFAPGGALVPHAGGRLAPASDPCDAAHLPVAATAVAPRPTSMQDNLSLLLRHKWLALTVFVLIAGTSIPLIWVLVIPQFRATSVVRVSPIVDKILHEYEGNGLLPLYSSFLNTQVSVIRSPKVLQRVLDLPEVQATAWYQEKALSLFGAPLPPLFRLNKSLSVSPRRKTELIDVSMTAKDASDVKIIADAVVRQYLDVVDEAGKESETGRMQTLLDRAAKLRNDVDLLVRQKGLVSKRIGTETPDELRSYHTTQLSVLEDERDALVREREHNEWKLERLNEREASGAEPDADADDIDDAKVPVRYVDDFEWRRLRLARDDAVHRLANLREHYGEAHPAIKLALADVEYAKQSLEHRELELDDPAVLPTRTVSGPDGTLTNARYDRVWLENAIAESVDKEQKLTEAIERQKEHVNLLSERAVDLQALDGRINEMRSEAAMVRARLNVLRMESQAAGRVGIASAAMLPARPYQDRRFLLTVMALIGAIGAGMGASFLRAFLDPSVRRIDDLAAVAHLPFLGYLPKVHFETELWNEASEELQESMRMIRTALLDRLPQGLKSSVLITSSGAKAGKTSVAMLLAKSLVDIHKKVLLVDADLRRASLTQRLEVQSNLGLTEVLTGSITADQAIVRAPVSGIDVIPSGACTPETDPELIANNTLRRCLEEWKRSYDIVIFDSPPILPVADARILAGTVDGAILAMRASHCRKSDVFGAVSLLASSGCKPLGTVLVGADHALGYGGGYERYSYSAQVVD